jgi:hypothetical protein
MVAEDKWGGGSQGTDTDCKPVPRPVAHQSFREVNLCLLLMD